MHISLLGRQDVFYVRERIVYLKKPLILAKSLIFQSKLAIKVYIMKRQLIISFY